MTSNLSAAESALDRLVSRYVDEGGVDALAELLDATSPALFRLALANAPDAELRIQPRESR